MSKGACFSMSTLTGQHHGMSRAFEQWRRSKTFYFVKADQCEFGKTVKEKGREHLIQKTTGFLTNSPEIAKELSRRCSGDHQHIQLKGGNLTKQAQVYPPELCKAICRGAAREFSFRGMGHFMIGSLDLVADTLGCVHGGGA